MNKYKDIVFQIYLNFGEIVFNSNKTTYNKLLKEKHRKKIYKTLDELKFDMIFDLGSKLYLKILKKINKNIDIGMDDFYEISFYTLLKDNNIDKIKDLENKFMIKIALFLENNKDEMLSTVINKISLDQ